MEEIWAKCSEFDNYSVSSHGRVRNDKTDRIMRLSTTQQGAVKVGLLGEGERGTRSVKRLVAEAFLVDLRDNFNSVINLDGNQQNNRVENLMWRPRWFVWKYTNQFHNVEHNRQGPVMDVESRLVYPTVVDACITYGLLFSDLHYSLANNVPVFPTWQIFDWADT